MKNKKGFTLIELLVVIVIIGIILGMSWPIISKVQDNNELSSYRKYGESLVAAAKLYVDAYEEDLFYYEDDLTEEEQLRGQCAFISYADLAEHQLIKDYSKNGITCNTESTYVKVVRKKDRYHYDYYLGCGYIHDDNSMLTNASGEIFFTLPEEQHVNTPDTATCNRHITEDEPPVFVDFYLYSSDYDFNSEEVVVDFVGKDNDTETKNLRYCVSESPTECNNGYRSYGNDYYTYGYYTLKDAHYDGSTRTVYVFLKDLNGNVTVQSGQYTLYKKCDDTVRQNQTTLSTCDKVCGGGKTNVKFDLYDAYLGEVCSTGVTHADDCNTFSCCNKVIKTCEPGDDLDSTQCDNACVGSTKLQMATCNSVSAYDGQSCGTAYRTVQIVPCNSSTACTYTNFLYTPQFGRFSYCDKQCYTSGYATGELRCTCRQQNDWSWFSIGTLSVQGINSQYIALIERAYDMDTGEKLCEKTDETWNYYCINRSYPDSSKNIMYVGYMYDKRNPSRKSVNMYYQLVRQNGVETLYQG